MAAMSTVSATAMSGGQSMTTVSLRARSSSMSSGRWAEMMSEGWRSMIPAGMTSRCGFCVHDACARASSVRRLVTPGPKGTPMAVCSDGLRRSQSIAVTWRSWEASAQAMLVATDVLPSAGSHEVTAMVADDPAGRLMSRLLRSSWNASMAMGSVCFTNSSPGGPLPRPPGGSPRARWRRCAA